MADDIKNKNRSIGEKITQAFAWVESAASINKAIKILAGLCVLLLVLDIIIHRHSYAPGEGTFGFYSIVGFFSFLLIVLGAKKLRTWILRDESYYAPNSVDSEEYPVSSLGIENDEPALQPPAREPCGSQDLRCRGSSGS